MIFLPSSVLRRAVCLGAPVALFSIGNAAARAAGNYRAVSISAAVTAAGATASTNEATSVGLNASDQVVGLTGSFGGSVYVFNASTNSATVLSQVTQNITTGFGVAINASGSVVGRGSYSGSTTGFSYNSTAGISPVNSTIGSTSYPVVGLTGINSSGIAAGYVDSTATGSSATHRAAIYNTNTHQMFDVGSAFSGTNNGSNPSTAYSINDSGVVVGKGPDNIGNLGATGPTHYFIATPSSPTPGPGVTYSYNDISTAVNNIVVNGVVTPSTTYGTGSYAAIDANGNVAAIYSPDSGTAQAFIYDASAQKAYQIPIGGNGKGATVTGMADVNGSVLIVGDYASFSYQYTGYVATETNVNGVVTVTEQTLAAYSGVLNTNGTAATFTDALAVNSNGDIVADGTVNGVTGIYLLTAAAPEPTSIVLLATGVVPMLFGRRGRRTGRSPAVLV